MPPRKRAEAPAVEPDAEQPCPEHWPLGWETIPAEHKGVGCEHGSWTRPGGETEATDES